MVINQFIVGLLCYFLIPSVAIGQGNPYFPSGLEVAEFFDFERNATSVSGKAFKTGGKTLSFVSGLDGKAVRLGSAGFADVVGLEGQRRHFSTDTCFTVQFWVRTAMDSNKPAVIISQKTFDSKDLTSQKKAGWAFYINGGTWAWNMGAGHRRITHESDGAKTMPLNDGEWHQLTMTYDSRKSEVRLFYDGDQKVIYNLKDDVGFDFSNDSPMMIGSNGTNDRWMRKIEEEIAHGAAQLQKMVDAFDGLNLGALAPDQFESLVVDPQGVIGELTNDLTQLERMDLGTIDKLRSELMENPYTIHQVRDFMRVAPLFQIYSLADGKVTVNRSAATEVIEKQRLFPAEIDIDNLMIVGRALSAAEIAESYAVYFKNCIPTLKKSVPSIVAANWNIHHGGKHNTVEKDGWDSRERIVELLEEEGADVIMLQETYSLGAFIANQLGFYYASTVDLDYLNQGSNISVLSRYPIEQIYVPIEASFMNIAARLKLSQTQDLYVMSNWYGMAQFPNVYDFHRDRFLNSDEIPVIFAGDFNAIPHSDGGESMASRMLMEAGFTDAFRERYPSIGTHPGHTHNSNRRIDQLYYKGSALKNTDTKIISTWPTGFPSDHSLIITKFDLITN